MAIIVPKEIVTDAQVDGAPEGPAARTTPKSEIQFLTLERDWGLEELLLRTERRVEHFDPE